jgi:Na+/H+-dicarboxylate symporter
MLKTYCALYVIALVLMSVGCGLPAVILAVIAGVLALREELRTVWQVARSPVPTAAPHHEG